MPCDPMIEERMASGYLLLGQYHQPGTWNAALPFDANGPGSGAHLDPMTMSNRGGLQRKRKSISMADGHFNIYAR